MRYFTSYNTTHVPLRFHRIITNLNETTIRGTVIRKLSIISIVSPQTRISAHTSGTPETSITVMKIMSTRISGLNLFLDTSSAKGHKPINPKPKRCNSTAHKKSNNFLYKIKVLDKIITSCAMTKIDLELKIY